jgi:hypothetical protein
MAYADRCCSPYGFLTVRLKKCADPTTLLGGGQADENVRRICYSQCRDQAAAAHPADDPTTNAGAAARLHSEIA